MQTALNEFNIKSAFCDNYSFVQIIHNLRQTIYFYKYFIVTLLLMQRLSNIYCVDNNFSLCYYLTKHDFYGGFN